MLRNLMTLAIVLSSVSVSLAQDKVATNDQLYWIFLNTGKSTAGVAKEEVQKMQAAHLENFGRLAKEGKLLAAGPMKDPEKKKRGIVVAKAANVEGLNKHFEPDPYVQNGYLTVEAIPMKTLAGEIHTSLTPTGMEEMRLVVLTRSNTEGRVGIKENIIGNVKDLNGLKFAAEFIDTKSYQGILVFAGANDAPVQTALDSLSSVKEKEFNAAIMPLYVGKGTFVLEKAKPLFFLRSISRRALAPVCAGTRLQPGASALRLIGCVRKL